MFDCRLLDLQRKTLFVFFQNFFQTPCRREWLLLLFLPFSSSPSPYFSFFCHKSRGLWKSRNFRSKKTCQNVNSSKTGKAKRGFSLFFFFPCNVYLRFLTLVCNVHMYYLESSLKTPANVQMYHRCAPRSLQMRFKSVQYFIFCDLRLGLANVQFNKNMFCTNFDLF